MYCLSGGAWDRPTLLGQAENYEDACILAEKKQAAFVANRSEPVCMLSPQPPHLLVREAQRPDHQPVVLREFTSTEELEEYSRQLMESKYPK